MPFGAKIKKTESVVVQDQEVIEPVDSAQVPPTPVRKRRAAARTDRPKKRPIALPVLVVDETVLLPHMSIPFPIDDDEAAQVIDRASRMPLRQVLVLTERPIRRQSADLQIGRAHV